jgi:menaquinone-dependent protoporphyrinogen oxidase
MKTAIIYATSHGTTEKVATQIQSELGSNTVLINLKQTKTIDLAPFDTVVIGGSIHAGQMQGRVKSFCKKNLVELLKKRVALYMCGMNEPEFESELSNAFPELLRKHAITSKSVGGEFLFEKMNFIEKLIVRKVSGIDQNVSKIDKVRVTELINDLKKQNPDTCSN